MIEQLIVVVLIVTIDFLVGMVCGQYSVWRWLREKGQVIRDGWSYAATKLKEEEYKCWN